MCTLALWSINLLDFIIHKVMNSIAPQLKYNIRSIKCHDSREPCLNLFLAKFCLLVTKRDSMRSVQRAFGCKKIAQKSPYFEGKKKSSIAIFRQRLPGGVLKTKHSSSKKNYICLFSLPKFGSFLLWMDRQSTYLTKLRKVLPKKKPW